MQPPDGDHVPEPGSPQPPPLDPRPDVETTRMPWAPAEPAPASATPAPAAPARAAPGPIAPAPAAPEPEPAPVAPTGWTQPGEPRPSGWTEAPAQPVTACLIIILIGVVGFLVLIVALIYIGSQVSTILSTVGDSV